MSKRSNKTEVLFWPQTQATYEANDFMIEKAKENRTDSGNIDTNKITIRTIKQFYDKNSTAVVSVETKVVGLILLAEPHRVFFCYQYFLARD